MKTKKFLTIFAALALLAQMPILTLSQSNGLTPDAATGFSTFSMPQNLGASVNSEAGDTLPVLAPSGLSLYFATDRPGGLGGPDIWVSQRATLSSAWGAAQNVAILNTSSFDGVGGISPDGRELFMHSQRPGGIGGSDLYARTQMTISAGQRPSISVRSSTRLSSSRTRIILLTRQPAQARSFLPATAQAALPTSKTFFKAHATPMAHLTRQPLSTN